MDKIHILQLGNEDWSKVYTLPEMADWEYLAEFTEPPEKPYDVVFLDRQPSDGEIGLLYKEAKAHTLFVTDRVDVSGGVEWLFQCKKAKKIAADDIQEFLLQEVRYYYPKPYGEKFDLKNLAISHEFSGAVKWNGNYSVVLNGDFGEEFRQIAFWRNNIPLFQGQVIDLWLEYCKDPGVSITLSVTQFVKGSLSEIYKQWEFREDDLGDIVQIDSELSDTYVFVSLLARGSGELQVIALHDRYSRGKHGFFLPGGERYVTSAREEIFCYFDPGDRKPPLNVFFSGYKTAQGFEGYYLMRGMGCPFLLIAEPRLEGGSFYMGDAEYEKLMTDVIRTYMEELGFLPEQVIFAGLSMGTYGALYYGCDIRPHAMILGKPLASIGNVAANEKHYRPGGFATSLDVLNYLCGDTDAEAVKKLNSRFWDKFDAVDWGKSKFIVSYMIEDDYDRDAYESLLFHLRSGGVQVYGKGIHGKHNDNTAGIVSWFSSQYKKILQEDFSRRVESK